MSETFRGLLALRSQKTHTSHDDIGISDPTNTRGTLLMLLDGISERRYSAGLFFVLLFSPVSWLSLGWSAALGGNVKTYLFLYTIRAYVNRILGDPPDPWWVKWGMPELYSRIIDARYRQRGYRIVWLLYSKPDDLSAPDMEPADSRFGFCPTDVFLSAGLPHAMNIKYFYPSGLRIVRQLGSVKELVLGGFHQDDCVDRIARVAHRSGMRVIVDEDTTDYLKHYLHASRGKPPALVRTPEEYMRAYIDHLRRDDPDTTPRHVVDDIIRVQREDRTHKPWLVMF